jgi:hypothetical protein
MNKKINGAFHPRVRRFYERWLAKMATVKNATVKTAVMIVMILSAPLSFVRVKIFIWLPPMTALEAPWDLPD